MMKMTRIALVAASLAVCSFTVQAANVEGCPVSLAGSAGTAPEAQQ